MVKLGEYRRKRQFGRTPEPPPGKGSSQQDGTFVVQKHAATRLHYDFRLAIDGVLKSWAVPKGPSLNPADKRLAVQTEDHPMDYANFEGVIPKGSYGAGNVMVWDRGTFSVIGEPNASRQVARGEIKFDLSGEKLRGSFVLVKLHHSQKGNEWLMIKHKDAAVDPAWNIDEHDGSVLTGRTLDEIGEQAPPKRAASPVRAAEIEGARKAAMPAKVDPMLSTPIDRPFSDDRWIFEIKWDGVRALAWVNDGKLALRARSGSDITGQYPELSSLPDALSARRAILDGEIVALDARGRSQFERLQRRMHVRAPAAKLVSDVPVTFYAFDLLYCDGYDLRDAALLERKELLRRILHSQDHVRFSDHQVGQGNELFELARENGLEGILGKLAESRYVSARSPNWVKIKVTKTIDAVVGGWTAPRAGRSHFGSLLLGLYEGKKLRFIGHVGGGFDAKSLDAISKELKTRATSSSPFERVPETNEKAFWTKPRLVARVRFTEWTDEHALRHPVFLGLREDARPEDCRWESEVAVDPAPVMARAPEVTGTVLSSDSQIENELFKGHQQNIVLEMEGKRFRLSNLNKVYFPPSDYNKSAYTKRDLLAYYYRMAEYILPFLKDRPLVLRRYPDGIKGQAFFQKDVREGIPDWLETVTIASEDRAPGKKDEEIHYAIANDRASLLFLTGLGCIDHNPWSSRRDDLEEPDYFFFDLDPADGTDFSTVLEVARALYDRLEELEMNVFLKTSGATGFHLYLPVERGYSFEQLRTFAEIVARLVTAEHPNLVTQERTVSKRLPGRVLIDVHQNAYGRPLAAPYAVRAFPGAPVSAPVTPRELRAALRPEKFNLKNMPSRVQKTGDLWKDFWKSRQRIENVLERLDSTAAPRARKKRQAAGKG